MPRCTLDALWTLGASPRFSAGGVLRRDFEMLRRAADRQRTRVVRLVTAEACEDQVGGIMTAAVGAVKDVVELEPSARSAAGHAAPHAVSAPYEPGDAGRYVMIRALGHSRVERAQLLGV